MKRKQFTFYESFDAAMDGMTISQQGRAIRMVCDYALRGIEPPPLNGKLKIFMDLVKPTLRTARNRAFAGTISGAVRASGKKEIETETDKEIEIDTDTEKEFEAFWDQYPRKVGRMEAEVVWKEKKLLFSTVKPGLELWCRSKQWRASQGVYIPMPENFLKMERWRESPPQEIPMGATGQLGQAELEAIDQMMGGGNG